MTKANTPKKSTRTSIDTTYLLGRRQDASEINELICQNLPVDEETIGPFISYATDTINQEKLTQPQHFNHYTNLPEKITLQEGARVMFLNNKLFEHNICNGTIGIITNLIDNQTVEVTFPTPNDITKVNIQKETAYFNINGNPATRQQFPLQNAFALTIHKTQGLTLPHTTINVNQNIFATGQVYVAMSRAPSWEALDIITFDFSAIKTDPAIAREYARLNHLYERGLNKMK